MPNDLTTQTDGPLTPRTAWRRAAVTTAGLWLVTMVVVAVATPILAVGETAEVASDVGFSGYVPPPTDASGLELVRTGLLRQDAMWYAAIARDGYPTSDSTPAAAAFFPAFPGAIAAVATAFRLPLEIAANVVALLACVAALAGLHRLAERLADGALARRTLVVTAAFPTSFFLIAPYSEGLFLSASTWALVHLVDGRPWRAACLTGIATLTRPVGVLLAVPIILGVLQQDEQRPASSLRSRLIALGGIGLAGSGLLLHGWLSWGAPLAMLDAQSVWQRTVVPFYRTIFHAVRFGVQVFIDGSNPYHLLDVLVFAATITGLVALARRHELPLTIHGGISVLLWTTIVFSGRPLMSTPRFALALPGVMLGLATLAGNPRFERWWLPVSSVLFTVHLVLFTRWWFVF